MPSLQRVVSHLLVKIGKNLRFKYKAKATAAQGFPWFFASKFVKKIHQPAIHQGKQYHSNCSCKVIHIQSWKTWKSHGIPFSFSRPGKVMEFDSRFWKIHKSHGNYKKSSCGTVRFGSCFKSCTLTQGYGYVQHENRSRFNLCHHILFNWLTNITVYGLSHTPFLPRYMSLSCHKSCKRSLNF